MKYYSKTEAQELLKTAKEYSSALSSMQNGVKLAEASLIKAADNYYLTLLDTELQDISVDALSKSKMGIRTSPLKEAGYYNLLQLKDVSYVALSRLEGIGETSAQRISYSVKKIIEDTESGLKVKLHREHENALEDELVCAICRYVSKKEISVSAAELSSMYGKELSNGIRKASAAAGGLRSLLSSRKAGEEAQDALNRLEALFRSDFGISFRELKNAEKRIDCNPEEAWDDFESRASTYYAVLEEIASISKKSAFGKKVRSAAEYAVRRGLPDELAIEVEDVELNLTGLKCTLRSYQYFGVQYILNQGAVLLGDEMGLGKTVQAIAAMVCLRNRGDTHFMVVCPAGVLVNWCREIEKHSDLKPIMVHGADTLDAIGSWRRNGGVAVTTYETISRFTLPEDFTFSMLVADEAHYVKNPEALRTASLMVIRRHTGRVLFMTGTALENNVDEMNFLISCLQPDVANDVKNSTALGKAAQYREKVAYVYFRRTREDVLDELPEKEEYTVWCSTGTEERNKYNVDVMNNDFMGMRQVSWSVNDPQKSVKAQQLVAICDEAVETGKKILVFSFFINTIEQAIKALDCPVFGPINGSVSPDKRQKIIDDFTAHQGGAVLVSQIQAGGTGLNIQAASVVVFCEPQLKPSLETQAVSRAYRMGQVNKVLVYRLLCDDSIDERIMEILENKQELFDNFAEKSVSGEESLKFGEEEYQVIIEAEKQKIM